MSGRRSRAQAFLLVLSLLTFGACARSERRVWLAPDLASHDTVDLFSHPELWPEARSSTDVFKFYGQQLVAESPGECP